MFVIRGNNSCFLGVNKKQEIPYLAFPLGTLGTAFTCCFSLSDSSIRRLLSGAITGDEPAAGISVGDMSEMFLQISVYPVCLISFRN